MTKQHIAMIGMAILGACGLAACGSDEKEAAAAAQAKQAVEKKQVVVAPADPTAKMAHAVVVGKAGANVDLKYDILNKPEPGKVVEVELALIPGTVVDSMTVSVSALPGLTVKDAEASFGKLATGEAAHHKFTVVADHPDVVYLTVTATTYAVGLSSTRSFAIPLIVTDPAAAAAKAEQPAAPTQARK